MSRISVLAIDMRNEEEALDIFDAADVSKCKCTDEKEKQKLLGANKFTKKCSKRFCHLF